MSEVKEPSAQDKLQGEYNHIVGLMGHNRAQILSLEAEYVRLCDNVQKIIKKAANIANPKGLTKSKEETKEEVQNVPTA